jgi:K+-dependent Na+/Ca+ exchanger-like protein
MATATTTPEFFSNTISTFLAESDMGMSGIVGSMLFNTLGVAACAAFFVKKPIQIHWWPITRDSIILTMFIMILITFAWDSTIMWWETCILVSLYILYWIFMFQNKKISKFVIDIVENRFLWCQRIKDYDIDNQCLKSESPSVETEDKNDKIGVTNGGYNASAPDISHMSSEKYSKRRESVDWVESGRRPSTDLAQIYAVEEEEEFKLWELPRGASKFDYFWYFFTWPIRFCLHYTIPNPIRYKKWYVVSFIMCMIWIAATSYMVFWMVVLVGDTFGIPDPIMGLTFLAFGGCMPEAISAVIVARKGSGQMGVSNALGANCLAIVFSLGLPWFIKTMADGAWTTGAYIRIYSLGMEFILMSIILAVFVLYIVIAALGYKLRRRAGAILMSCYLIFATFAILVELELLFDVQC